VRFAGFTHQGRPGAGVVADDQVHPLEPGVTVLELVQAGAEELARAGERALSAPPIALGEVALRAPLEPPTLRDFITFEAHVDGIARRFGDDGAGPEWYAAPAFYFSNPYAVVGPFDPVPVPPGCRVLDFELELAAVVGRAGRDLTPEQAREHIVGYTILNDWSARDLQAREMAVHLGPAKGKDTATTLGPYLVTADELEPFRTADGRLDLEMVAIVNGVEIGRDTAAHMAWTFEELVAYAARGTWVRPGDVLGSGTCGSGCLAELWGRSGRQEPPPLQPGDVVELRIAGLGAVRNVVVPGVAPVPSPAARRVRPHAG
jgi:2-keto-4-pentenoate hydratase/2-oxohepta-3-ene-1,7-dioic acid hydratase in catechol pathway